MKQIFVFAALVCLLARACAAQNQPTPIPTYVGYFANLPTNPPVNTLAVVLDGNGVNCASGGGSVRVWCQWSGTAWVFVGGSGGSGSGPTVQTNGVNNTSQSFLNLQTSVTNAVGLTLTPSNPSTGNERFEIAGILTSTGGGSGRSNPTANSVLLSEGSSPFNSVAPGTSGYCFISNGTGVDPSYQVCPGGNPSFPLTVAGTVNSGGVPYFSSTVQESSSNTLPSGYFVLGGGLGGAPTASFSVIPTANGGTGTSSPSAYTVPVSAGGTSAFNFVASGANGTCFMSNGLTSYPSFQTCPSGSGFANPMTTLGDIIYGGASGTATRLAGPVSPNGVPQVLVNVPALGAATAESWAVPGVPFDTQSGASYPVPATDRLSLLQTTNSTTSTAVSIPQAGTTGYANNFAMLHCNTGSVVATDTPTTSTINGNSTIKLVGEVTNPECAFIWSDNSNYWAAEILPTDANGRLQAAGFPALTGDVTTTAGAVATTLATVNSNVGSYTNANITVNAKGLVTAAANGSGGSGGSMTTTNETASFSAAFAATPVAYNVTGCVALVVATLPASIPTGGRFINIQNNCNWNGYLSVAVNPNGLTLAGSAASLLIPSGNSLWIISDGTNYQILGNNNLNSVQPLTRRIHREAIPNYNSATLDSLGLHLNAAGGTQSVIAAIASDPVSIKSLSAASANTANGWNEGGTKVHFTGNNNYYGTFIIPDAGGSVANQRIVAGFTGAAITSYEGATTAADNPTAYAEYFIYSTTFSGVSATDWVYCTGNNSAVSCTDSGISVVAGTSYQLEIQELSGLGTPAVAFYINGALVGVSTTDIPAAGHGVEMDEFQTPTTGSAVYMYLGYVETFSDVN